jgi:hypothetical protein
MTPASGVRGAGVTVTLHGAGFQRSRGLAVRFTTVAGASVTVPAVFVNSASIGAPAAACCSTCKL